MRHLHLMNSCNEKLVRIFVNIKNKVHWTKIISCKNQCCICDLIVKFDWFIIVIGLPIYIDDKIIMNVGVILKQLISIYNEK